MKKKSSRNTKSKIVSAAWQLFYQQGYDNTTIDEIVSASGTSKGSFYRKYRVSGPSLPALRLPIDHQRRAPSSGNQQNILQAAAPDNH